MPISETGRPNRAAAGLTLIELVVVVAILGLLSLPVVLRFGGGGLFGGAAPAQRIAGRLGDDLARMRDQALFGRQVLGLGPRPDGWDWLSLDAGTWETAEAVRFDGAALVWQVRGRPVAPREEDEPLIVLLPDLSATPFTLRIGAGGPVCGFDGWGELSCAVP